MEEVNFKEQLKLGKDGEDKVFNYLNNLEDTFNVINCTQHVVFQAVGVDGFLIEDKKQLRGTFFDVKTDYQYHRSGKLFIEIMADTNMNKKGGILSTKANVFYYYDPFGGHLFELPIYAMQRWYDRIGISMNHIEKVNQYNQKTTGVLVSPEDLEIEGVLITTDNIGPLKYA
jgi:hypothetical protein